jgi:hypothetical protein
MARSQALHFDDLFRVKTSHSARFLASTTFRGFSAAAHADAEWAMILLRSQLLTLAQLTKT